MSQSYDGVAETAEPSARRGHERLSRLLETGRSFSGYERHRSFLNLGSGRFADVSALSGLDLLDDGRGMALSDWDQDGDVDVWISNRTAPQLRFLRNDSAPGNRHLALRLRGDGSTTNRDAVGARVEVAVGARRLIRTLRAGEGFLSQSTKWLHFGLGSDHADVSSVTVRWPNGDSERFDDVAADRRYLLVQGAAAATTMPAVSRTLAIRSGSVPALPEAGAEHVRLGVALPAPPLRYERLDGGGVTEASATGGPMLVVLWASWCLPCHAELAEIGERADALRAAGVDVIALSVDEIDGVAESTAESARAVLEKTGFPFQSGMATAALLAELQHLHDLQMIYDLPFPVPTTLLVDARGRLDVVYKGKVAIDRLLEDAGAASARDRARWPLTAALPGSVVDHPVASRGLTRARTSLRLQAAAFYEDRAYREQAIAVYADALADDRDNVPLHQMLAARAVALERLDEAERWLARAVELDGSNAIALNDLGTVRARRGKIALAIGHFEAALRIDPGLEVARRRLARLREIAGE